MDLPQFWNSLCIPSMMPSKVKKIKVHTQCPDNSWEIFNYARFVIDDDDDS